MDELFSIVKMKDVTCRNPDSQLYRDFKKSWRFLDLDCERDCAYPYCENCEACERCMWKQDLWRCYDHRQIDTDHTLFYLMAGRVERILHEKCFEDCHNTKKVRGENICAMCIKRHLERYYIECLTKLLKFHGNCTVRYLAQHKEHPVVPNSKRYMDAYVNVFGKFIKDRVLDNWPVTNLDWEDGHRLWENLRHAQPDLFS